MYYCCVTNYHRLSRFRQQTNHFRFSMGQESGHTQVTWVLTQGSVRLQSRCQLGLHSNLNWERLCFQAHSGCWQNSFPCSHMTKASCWLLAEGVGVRMGVSSHVQLLEPACNSCHVVPSTGNLTTQQLTSSKLARKGSPVQVGYQDGVLYSVIYSWEWHPIILVRMCRSHLRKGDCIRVEYQKMGIVRGHLRFTCHSKLMPILAILFLTYWTIPIISVFPQYLFL